MEKRVREYEKFIQSELKNSKVQKERLKEYHLEMVRCFQHERLVHLIIMWWFVIFATVLLVATGWTLTLEIQEWWSLIPLWGLTAIVVIMTGFYVKHYYFLENHVQKLYDLTKQIIGL